MYDRWGHMPYRYCIHMPVLQSTLLPHSILCASAHIHIHHTNSPCWRHTLCLARRQHLSLCALSRSKPTCSATSHKALATQCHNGTSTHYTDGWLHSQHTTSRHILYLHSAVAHCTALTQ